MGTWLIRVTWCLAAQLVFYVMSTGLILLTILLCALYRNRRFVTAHLSHAFCIHSIGMQASTLGFDALNPNPRLVTEHQFFDLKAWWTCLPSC